MEKLHYWLVRWPWIAGVIVFVGLIQLPLGPWYISALFIIGASMIAMTAARAEKSRLAQSTALLQARRLAAIRPSAYQGEKIRFPRPEERASASV
jgi:membrane protein implicated in regulation of membrane protease activity